MSTLFKYSSDIGMWVKLLQVFLCFILLLLNAILPINCHIPSYVSTPSTKVEQFCFLAEHCIHDTIKVCGKMGEQTRTFLDHCDLLEFNCDTSQIYIHIEDLDDCPPNYKGLD